MLRTRIALVALVLTACGGSSETASKPPAPAPGKLREREPNDRGRQAQGPIGPAGIVLTRQSAQDQRDHFYLKIKPGREVTLTVRHLAGTCVHSFVQTNYAGAPGPGNGGQDATAVAADAPVIDTNGNQDTSIGDTPGTEQQASLHQDDRNSSTGLEEGFVNYDDGDASTVGCSVLITPAPAGNLVTARSPQDAEELEDPDIDDQ